MGSTLIVQAELPEREAQARLRLLCQDLPEPLPPDRLWVCSDRSLRLDSPAGETRLAALIEQYRPDLVALDPLARFMAGDAPIMP